MICWKEQIDQIKPKGYQGCCLLLYLDWVLIQILWCCFAKCCVMCCCPDLCAPPTRYEYENISRSYRISNIHQITKFMTSEANCGWCCLDYLSGIEISFNQFNHPSNHLHIAYRSCFSGLSWLCSADDIGEDSQNGAVSSTTRTSYHGWARSVYGAASDLMGAIERSAGINSLSFYHHVIHYLSHHVII